MGLLTRLQRLIHLLPAPAGYTGVRSTSRAQRGRVAGFEQMERRLTLSADALDLSFGTDGRVVLSFDESSSEGEGEDPADNVGVAVAVDRAGRIVIAGSTQDAFGVSRLNTDGTLDTSFGTNGKAVLSLPSPDPEGYISGGAYSVAFDSQGRILLAGSFTDYQDDEDIRMFAATRLTPSGQQDLSFGDNGWTIFGFGFEGNQNHVLSACIDANDRLLLAGFTDRGDGDHAFAIARLTTTGALDASFSGDGRAVFDFNIGGGNADRATTITVDRNGRILVAGIIDVAEDDSDFGVVRLNANGTLDRRFGRNGRVTIAFNLRTDRKGIDEAFDIAVDRAGRILVAGRVQTSEGDTDFAIARLSKSGKLTRDFGRKGRVVIPFNLGGGNYDGAWLVQNCCETRLVGRVQLAIDLKGRIVVGGPVQTGSNDYDYGVVRLTSGGKPDRAFGANSRVVVAFNQAWDGVDSPLGVTTDRQNRVILVGNVQATPADSDGLWTDLVGVTRLAVNGRRPRR